MGHSHHTNYTPYKAKLRGAACGEFGIYYSSWSGLLLLIMWLAVVMTMLGNAPET